MTVPVKGLSMIPTEQSPLCKNVNNNLNVFDTLYKHSFWCWSEEEPRYFQAGIPGDPLSEFIQQLGYNESTFSQSIYPIWLDIAKPTIDDICYLEKALRLDPDSVCLLKHMAQPSQDLVSIKKTHFLTEECSIILTTAFDPTPLTTSYSLYASKLDAKEKPILESAEDKSTLSLNEKILFVNNWHEPISFSKISDHRFDICGLAYGQTLLITFRLSSLSYCSRFLVWLNKVYNRSGICSDYWKGVMSLSLRHDIDFSQLQLLSWLYAASFNQLIIQYFPAFSRQLEGFFDRFELSKLVSIRRLSSHPLPILRHSFHSPSLGEFWLFKRKLTHLKKYLTFHTLKFSALNLDEFSFPDVFLILRQISLLEKKLKFALDEHHQISELRLISSCSYRDVLLKKLSILSFISLPISVTCALFSMNIPLPWMYADPTVFHMLYYYNYSASPFYFTLFMMLFITLINLYFLKYFGVLEMKMNII